MSVDVITFGCRLNTYESEVIRRQAQAAGVRDAVVFNTGPTTISDFVTQRRRNHAGHLYLKSKYGYAVSSIQNKRVAKVALKEIWGAIRPMAALIFLAYLTLKAWDIGGGGAAQPDPRAVARACAYLGLLIAAVTVVARLLFRGALYFDLTAAAVLQIVLHGFAGIHYLVAGTISVLLLAATLTWRVLRARSAGQAISGGQP